jgi:ABC-2 type transport system permease protein
MLKLARKDLKLFFADKRAMMLTFALPIILITLFAYAFGAVGKRNKQSEKYNLTVSDLDSTISSRDAISGLDSQKTLHVSLERLETAQDAVRKGKKDAVLIFHKGFGDSLANGNPLPVELQYDEAQEAQVGMLQQALFSTLAMLPYGKNGNLVKTMNKGFDRMLGKSDEQIKNSVHSQVESLSNTIQNGMKANPDMKAGASYNMGSEIKMTKLVQAKEDNSLGLVQAVAGTAIMMLLFSVAGMGASLLDEKQEGTLKKLLYSPMNPNNILFGKMVYMNLISITQLTIMFVYASLVLGLDIKHHIPSLVIMIFFTAYACSSFGVFLSSFAKTRQQVQGFSTLIVLVMSCIGGSMIPEFIMPSFMQKISVFSVNYWGIQGFYDIFWRLLPISDMTFLSRILVLAFIGTLLNYIALQMFKKNILKIA